jgi:hypothetical protein
MSFMAQEIQSIEPAHQLTADLDSICPDCGAPARLIEVQTLLRDMEGEVDTYPRFHLSCIICTTDGPPSPTYVEQCNAFLLAEIIKIEDEKARGCGQYYEIYHYRVLEALDRLDDTLSLEDSLRLRTLAAERDWTFGPADLAVARAESEAVFDEIYDEE